MTQDARGASLRVSGILRDLDGILDAYTQDSDGIPKDPPDGIQENPESVTEKDEDSDETLNIDEEWKSLLRKKIPTQPHEKESSSSPSIAGKGRSKESMLISTAFNFLSADAIEEKDSAQTDSSLASGHTNLEEHSSRESGIDVGDSEERSDEQDSCLNEQSPVRESRVVSAAFGFLKDDADQSDDTQSNENNNKLSIVLENPDELEDKNVTLEQNCCAEKKLLSVATDNESSTETEGTVRESRAVSAAFNFLKDEDDHETQLVSQNKLSAVLENDSETIEDESDGLSNGITEQPERNVTFRERSRSKSPSVNGKSENGEGKTNDDDKDAETDDDEDDDSEVHVVPGAWRNSVFAYVGDNFDTESAASSSASSTPRSASPSLALPTLGQALPTSGQVTPPCRSPSTSPRPASIFPPPKMSATNGSPRNHTSASDNNGSPRINIQSATDSEGGFGLSQETFDDSDGQDVFLSSADLKSTKKPKKKLLGGRKRPTPRSDSVSSTSTTVSEREFRTKYRSLQKTRILRNESTAEDSAKARKSNNVQREVARELILERDEDSAGFGFHIWGIRSIIVSTVELDSVAMRAGLREGDVIVAVNGINTCDSTTDQVVQLTGKGTRRVTLGLAADNLASEIPVCCGHLSKQSGNMLRKWRRRWVELRGDHCLYYYKDKGDVDPLGAVPVVNYTVTKARESNLDYAFKLTKYTAKTYTFTAESEEDMARWASAITEAAQNRNKANTWIDVSSHNVSLPALDIRSPDCHGYLQKMGNSNRSWRRRYCVLKDACLYYYMNRSSNTAKGVVHFHGYSVQGAMPHKKPFGFMLVPPEPEMRTFFFSAENETQQRMWLSGFQDSISKWVQVTD